MDNEKNERLSSGPTADLSDSTSSSNQFDDVQAARLDQDLYNQFDDLAGKLRQVGGQLPWSLFDDTLLQELMGEESALLDGDMGELASALRHLHLHRVVETRHDDVEACFSGEKLDFPDFPEEVEPSSEPFRGRFELRGAIGRGSFGIVYRAYDRIARREVALKMPRPELRGLKTVNQRFYREGSSVSDVVHPGLVPLLDIGLNAGVPYLVTRLVNGPNLEQWLEQAQRPIPPMLAAAWMKQLAEAIEHLHSRKLLHCDLKPSNILLEHPYAEDPAELPPEMLSIRVTDFGSASRIRLDEETRQSRSLGTLSFMAPEQFRADGQIDRRTDVYAISVILYELLTDKPIFEEMDQERLAQEIQSGKPIAPRKIRPELPVELEAITLKGLERNPEDRYQTAGEMARDLDAYLQMRVPQALKYHAKRRTTLFLKRNRVIAAGVFIAAMILSGYATFRIEESRVMHQLNVERTRLNWWNHYLDSIQIAQKYFRVNNQARFNSTLDSIKAWPAEAERQEDPREFSWYYLKNLMRERSDLVKGLPPKVSHYVMTASPASRTIWAAGTDGRIREIDPVGLEVKRTVLIKEGNEINSVACSADGRFLALGFGQGYIQIHDSQTFEKLYDSKDHDKEVLDILFTDDSRRLVSSGKDGRLHIWSFLDDKRVTFEDRGSDPNVGPMALRGMTLLPGGTHLAVGTSESKIKLIRLEDGENTANLLGHFDEVEQLTVSSDGKWLISASVDRTIAFWNLEQNKLYNQISMDENGNLLSPSTQLGIRVSRFSPLVCLPGENAVAVDVGQGHIQLYEIPSGNKIGQLAGHKLPIWSLIRLPWSNQLASFGRDNELRIWRQPYIDYVQGVYAFEIVRQKLDREKIIVFQDNHNENRVMEGGDVISSARFNMPNLFKCYDSADQGKIRATITTEFPTDKRLKNRINVCFDSLQTVLSDGYEMRWQTIADIELKKPLEDPKLAGHPNKPLLAMIDGDRNFFFVNLTDRDNPKIRKVADQCIYANFVPDSNEILVLRLNQSKQFLWNYTLDSWAEFHGGQNHGADQWMNAKFSPNGDKLAIYRVGGLVQIWNFKTRVMEKEIPIPEVGERRARLIEWSPDGRQILVAMGMKDLFLIDIATGQTMISWDIGFRSIRQIAFSSDGESVWIVESPTDFNRAYTRMPNFYRLHAPKR